MDLSRFASGVAAPPRPVLQIPFHGGPLQIASALRGCGSSGLFYSSPTQGVRLARPRCQGNDSLAYVDGPLEGTKGSSSSTADDAGGTTSGSVNDAEDKKRAAATAAAGDVDDLREALQRARKELEVARLNSTMFEGKAQRISESAIALKDRADGAQTQVSSAVATVQEIITKEDDAKEGVRKATMALSMAEARLQLAAEALDAKRGSVGQLEVSLDDVEEEALASAQEEIKGCQLSLSKCEEELRRVQGKKMELQKEVDRLR